MAKPTVGEYQIPFDLHGNPIPYAPYWDNAYTEWRWNYEFEATLNYAGFERGRSAAHLIFTSDEGRNYQMFLQQFDELMKSGGLDGNKLRAVWTFCKRGENYGVKLVRRLKVVEDEGSGS